MLCRPKRDLAETSNLYSIGRKDSNSIECCAAESTQIGLWYNRVFIENLQAWATHLVVLDLDVCICIAAFSNQKRYCYSKVYEVSTSLRSNRGCVSAHGTAYEITEHSGCGLVGRQCNPLLMRELVLTSLPPCICSNKDPAYHPCYVYARLRSVLLLRTPESAKDPW